MKAIWGFVAFVSLLSCGCAQWPALSMPNLRGEGFQESDNRFSKIGGKMRPKADLSAVGVSSKAREIEENLGAR